MTKAAKATSAVRGVAASTAATLTATGSALSSVALALHLQHPLLQGFALLGGIWLISLCLWLEHRARVSRRGENPPLGPSAPLSATPDDLVRHRPDASRRRRRPRRRGPSSSDDR
jgi:hypothetical protein